MNVATIRLVWRRADARCEYCRMPQRADEASFEVDHIIARKHGGPSVGGNLCLSCYHCKAHKGSDLASIDPQTGKLSPLFHPRRQRWKAHFRWDGASLIGRTAIGRVTIALLRINDPFRVELRSELIKEGIFPPGG